MKDLFASRSARLLALSYGIALSLIAAASVGLHVSGQKSAARQEALGELINVSGRQRMLSQRIAYLGRVITTADDGSTEATRAKFKQALSEFEQAHDELTRGSLLWRPDHPRAADLHAVYYGDRLDHDVRRLIVKAELLVEAMAAGAASADDKLHDAKLLSRLNEVTSLHELASEEIVSENKALAKRALGVVILLLLLEAAIVVTPTARRLARVENELTTLATVDPLTGVANRRSLFAAAQSLIRLSARARRPMGTIILDIDHFKRVNDEHGHGVGDDAIRHVVDLAREALRDSDLLGRIGGEEFVIVCPETSREGAISVAEKVRRAIEDNPLALPGGDTLPLTVSLGIHADLMRRDDEVDDLVAAADEALYEAKRTGRNKVVVAPPSKSMAPVAASVA